mmetsp:Transcript_12944/g.26376  ORF Transcript_12944/g.26376 Transcript_12944/m.26376 type:complete len:225 (+) Transcript_12944:1052-1726(+)
MERPQLGGAHRVEADQTVHGPHLAQVGGRADVEPPFSRRELPLPKQPKRLEPERHKREAQLEHHVLKHPRLAVEQERGRDDDDTAPKEPRHGDLQQPGPSRAVAAASVLCRNSHAAPHGPRLKHPAHWRRVLHLRCRRVIEPNRYPLFAPLHREEPREEAEDDVGLVAVAQRAEEEAQVVEAEGEPGLHTVQRHEHDDSDHVPLRSRVSVIHKMAPNCCHADSE